MPRNEEIYPASKLGVDPNRTLVNTSVSRYGLAALVTEACQIYGLNNQGQPGADWCVPRATGRRASTSTSATRRAASPRAPTATRRTCCTASGRRRRTCTTGRCRRSASCSAPPRARAVPARQPPLRRGAGRLRVGNRPAARYSPNDTMLVKEYDTTVPGKANGGHTFGPACVRTRQASMLCAIAARSRRASCVTRGSAARVPEDALSHCPLKMALQLPSTSPGLVLSPASPLRAA